ncbi:MAG: circularly permuted type 2 ATP-grasp protein [Myxococcales bacterium]
MFGEPSSTRVSALARLYAPLAGVFDETKSEDGVFRPHWRHFWELLDKMGPGELYQRWQKAQHLLHENGVSYNVYGDPQGMERPWSLSPIPVLIAAEEWHTIENGLAQRARLLDALLKDLYGPQRVLTEGHLPPELVFENPCFLRAIHGMNVPRDRWLPLYGADLVRLPQGGFAVLEDRTQAPSGAGYALENRIVISSVLPEAFRDCNVERLALFFRALRDTLHSLAPHNRDNPRIVLLTPGPYNATYFEQAFLANYLGYTLVNGGDLTVREDRVYLKTLGGLQQVDVILRRVNDDYCDPLELRPDSVLGIPGLVQAARAGNVAIASPLGTGLLQTHAILPYLARLSRALLGEDLRLPSVRTFWCGDPEGLAEAAHRFDDVVVRRTYSEGFVQAIFTAELDRNRRAELLAEVRARPRQFVVQERVHPSTVPLMTQNAFTPRTLVMRCFAVAGRDEYVVMPGGLSRVASGKSGTEVSMQLGAGSKDTWIVSREPVSHFSLLPPINRPVELSRGGSDLPSRAADNLFWLGRYAERAEGVARLARVVAQRLSDIVNEDDLENSIEFVPLMRTLTAQTALNYTAPLAAGSPKDLRAATQQLVAAVFDENGAGTLKAVVRSTLRAGRLVRDRISADTWRVLAALDDELHGAELDLEFGTLGKLYDVLNRVVLRLAAFSGLVMESMTRGQAWRFLDMGRRLERALSLVTLLRGSLGQSTPREGPLLEAVLEVADSGMTYRRRYLATLQVAPVVDLLLTDETNPRSVIYQLEAVVSQIVTLPSAPGRMRTPQERIALSLLNDLKLTDIEHACAPDSNGERQGLSDLLLDFAARIPALSDSLSDRYLNHATVSRHLKVQDTPEPADAIAGVKGGDS